jgi:hypothetical protein
MLSSLRLIILLFLLSSCSKDIMEYPNSNFLRYTPKSSAGDISNPAMLINNKPVRLPDLQPKDFQDKNVQSYFNSKYPNPGRVPRAGLGGYPLNQPRASVQNYAPLRQNLPARQVKQVIKPQNSYNSYDYAQKYYKGGSSSYQPQKPNLPRVLKSQKFKNNYDDKRGFRQILKPRPAERYPEITPQYPYKKEYQESKEVVNPHALTQEKRAKLGLLENDFFVPKFKKDYYNNSNGYIRNNKQIEVIEEFDNNILDNMINDNVLDQRFKTKSLPSF